MSEEQKDPDYNEFHETHHVDRSKIHQLDTQKQTVLKIEKILREQFDTEIEAKTQEISIVNRNIRQSKAMLDRLRAYVVASYYGSGEKLIPMSKAVNLQTNSSKKKEPGNTGGIMPVKKVFAEQVAAGKIQDTRIKDQVPVSNNTDKTPISNHPEHENRFYITKKVIVGNVSKYLVAGNQKEKDGATHKWMVYVRGPENEPDISHYIKSVWFFLHPSYIPNDIVQVHHPPFQLTRRGWGEFPIRVQLHFKESNNKRFDIIHNLKLDKTYTGLQTLGAETSVKLELCRHGNDNLLVAPSTSREVNKFSSLGSLPIAETITRQNSEDEVRFETRKSLETSVHESGRKASVDNEESLSNIKLDPVSRLKQIEVLSSVVSSCVTSAAVSRSTSPVQLDKAKLKITDLETKQILHELIIDSPLISKQIDVRLRPFSCPSLELYSKWSFSKRRAAEWQRAVFMKRLFIEYIDAYNKAVTIPTTKQIMFWCRENGFTPTEYKLKVVSHDNFIFCQLCGGIIKKVKEPKSNITEWCEKCLAKKKNHCKESSISAFTHILKEIENKEKALVSLNKLQAGVLQHDTDDNEIDVESSEVKIIPDRIPKEKILTVSPSRELQWISDISNELGIDLPPVTCNSIRAPILQAMLFTVLKSFVTDLVCKSNTEAVHENNSTLEPALVTFKHVTTALNKTPKFDFLTDTYVGSYNDMEKEENKK